MKTLKKLTARILPAALALALVAGTAAAEWRYEKDWIVRDGVWAWYDTWVYYDEAGQKVTGYQGTGFEGQKNIDIPKNVTPDRGSLKKLSRETVLNVAKGSEAEKFAKQYGYQYDNGEKRIVGYNITDLDEKADWIVENYVEDNYKGGELTDEEKARVLHDWLTTNATYDYYGLDNRREHTYSAEGVLLDGTGVCDSYSQAYSYLLNKVDILNRYIAGDTTGNIDKTNHAWDMILIDGQWYHTDVTWDDPTGENAAVAPVTTGSETDLHFMTDDEGIKVHSENRTWRDDVSADENKVGFVFTDEGTYYYGDAAETAKASTGWQEVTHNEDYASGYYWMYNPTTNQKQYEYEGEYYFGKDGKMRTGFVDTDGNTYYLDEKGLLQKDAWIKLEDDKYHAQADGALDKGFTDLTEDYLQWNGKTGEWDPKTGVFTYYFDDAGKMHVGWLDKNGETYHMADNGRMEKNAWITEGSDKYHAGADGALDKGGFTDLTEDYLQWNGETGEWDPKTGVFTYYFDDDGKMHVGWISQNGETYHMADNGRMEKGFQTVDNTKYYFDDRGRMQTGLFRVDGKLHYAEKDGELTDDLTDGFVARCYELILGREADEGGLKNWSARLKNGSSTAAEIVSGFVNSPEFHAQGNTDEDTVEILYNTMLGRGSDPGGKAGWTSYLSSGCSDGAVINGFCGSQEFMGLCAEFQITAGSVAPEARDYNRNLTAFVGRCYAEALNRQGESGGLNYWCGQIISGSQTPKQVAAGFVFSQELNDRNLSDEEKIDLLYRLYLGRPADQGGKEYWMSQMAAGMGFDQLNEGFANSAEFAGIVQSYGLQ